MRVLSLGMDMFHLCIHQQDNYSAYLEDSLFQLLEEHKIDVALLQEVSYARIKQFPSKFQIILPYPYNQQNNIDFRQHLTLALHHQSLNWQFAQDYLDEVAGKYMVSIRDANYWTILGVHMPLLLRRTHEQVWEQLLLEKQHWHLIVGNFNAHNKKPKSKNWQVYQRLTQEGSPLYHDLWNQGLLEKKAYYLNYRGEKHLAVREHFYRTTNSNTQIDYVLGRNVRLNEIILDMRTLSFTNHCALIVDCDKS